MRQNGVNIFRIATKEIICSADSGPGALACCFEGVWALVLFLISFSLFKGTSIG
jgi:hypothetical protein